VTRILLVRHGETEMNRAGRFQGHTDAELSEKGIMQAEKLRDSLAAEKIDAIYSSDLKRAFSTAEIIASRHKKKITVCPELREIKYGDLEGMVYADIKRRYPEIADFFTGNIPLLKFPGGESVVQFKKRIDRFLERLKDLGSDQTILIVAHGGPIRLIICSLLGIGLKHWRQIQLDNASLSIVTIYPEVTVLTRLNDISHLKG
jgi:alpha-ribazole phosphatase